MTMPMPAMGKERAWAMVVTMALLSVVAFVDRQVLSVLVIDIERDLGIKDVAFGWLLGPPFILSYNIVLIPLAFLIDARNRKRLIVGAVLLWCTMTALTAGVHGLSEFMLLRSGLAIGEAVLGPAAVSLIGDLFARERRVLPMAVYMTGSTVGMSGASLFGAAALQLSGWLHDRFAALGAIAGWRLTFLLVAIPGFLLIAVFAILAREPVRGATVAAGAEAAGDGQSFTDHLRASWPPYLLIALFSGCVILLATALTAWGPAYLSRAFALTPIDAGYMIGGVSLLCGASGCLIMPPLLRHRARDRDAEYALIEIGAAAFAIAVPAVVLYGFAPNLAWALAGLAIATTTLTSIFSMASQFVQLRTPSRHRAKALSLMLFVSFLVGGGIGPVLLPFVAGRIFTGASALGRSTATLAVGAALLSAPLLWGLLGDLGRHGSPRPPRGRFLPSHTVSRRPS